MPMRVIAGSAGGIPLKCPRNGHVRPTMDQVRAAIFSSLAGRVDGAVVLDLFAGTGGLGIEALSRGAKSVTFVEKDRRTGEYIQENLEKTRLETGAKIIHSDVFSFCSKLNKQPLSHRFNLIFADPPYKTRDHPADLISRLLTEAGVDGLLAEGGVLVLEKSPWSPLPAESSIWQIIRQKRYGTAEVVFLQHAAAVMLETAPEPPTPSLP